MIGYDVDIDDPDWDGHQLSSIKKNLYDCDPAVEERSQEDIDAYYKEHNIRVLDERGKKITEHKPIIELKEAMWDQNIDDCLYRDGIDDPTPIQAQAWPIVLKGHDLIGIAKTGSGKTLGFVLPAIKHILSQPRTRRGDGPRVVILAPTRELA